MKFIRQTGKACRGISAVRARGVTDSAGGTNRKQHEIPAMRIISRFFPAREQSSRRGKSRSGPGRCCRRFSIRKQETTEKNNTDRK